MKSDKIPRITILLGLLAVWASPVGAAPYAKGDRMDPFRSKTQHDQTYEFKPAETKYLLVSHDMETGKRANAALSAYGKEAMDRSNAVYLANIHGMPGVGRMFALPKMRKYPHTIVLGDDAQLIARFPQQQGRVTVLKLDGGRISSVTFWNPGEEALETHLK